MAEPRQAPDDLVDVGPSGFIQVHQAEPTEQQDGAPSTTAVPSDAISVDPDYVARQVDPINPVTEVGAVAAAARPAIKKVIGMDEHTGRRSLETYLKSQIHHEYPGLDLTALESEIKKIHGPSARIITPHDVQEALKEVRGVYGTSQADLSAYTRSAIAPKTRAGQAEMVLKNIGENINPVTGQGFGAKIYRTMGRGTLGAASGFQGAQAWNRAQEGDIPGAIVSGTGAVGSGLMVSRNPKAKGAGAILQGLSAIGQALHDKPEEKATGGLVHLAGGSKVKKFVKSLPMPATANVLANIGLGYSDIGRSHEDLQENLAGNRFGPAANNLVDLGTTFSPYFLVPSIYQTGRGFADSAASQLAENPVARAQFQDVSSSPLGGALAGDAGLAAHILNNYEDREAGGPYGSLLKRSRLPKFQAGRSVLKKVASRMTPGLDLGNTLPSAMFKAAPEQTVTDPLRNAFPGIYKRPDVIAQEAAARVAPESPALKQLFGVTRDDLYQMGKGRVGNISGVLPGAAANPKGSRAATGVMNPQNEQRLLDVLSESEKYPELVKGMDPWYIMDPAYNRLEQLVGPQEAVKKYKQFNTMTGMASPGSDVLTEMNRGTAANYLATQGRFGEFMDYAGKPIDARGADFPEDLRSVLGHPYHRTSQALPMQRYLDTGQIQMTSPKVPMYIDASGVPQTGFQTDMPVGDAHWSRAVGLADTRGKATRKGKEVIPGASVTNPEMSQLGPWWRDKIAAEVGLESVPAQARAWGAFSPQTGVESPIGAPKLELLAMKIMEAAKRYNISPEEARDLILKGEAYAGKKEGGLV